MSSVWEMHFRFSGRDEVPSLVFACLRGNDGSLGSDGSRLVQITFGAAKALPHFSGPSKVVVRFLVAL